MFIETDEGTLTNTVTEVDNFPQKVLLATQSDRDEIDLLSKRCIVFAKEYLNINHEPTLKELDQAFLLWQIKDKKKYTDEDIKQIIGSYFGNYCVNNADMEWVFVEDKYGKELAVQSNVYEVISFPYSIVQKRIDNNENTFLNNVYILITHQLNEERSKKR